ncbi:MAG TPA: hypothetical protein VH593_27945 [Ktedonobacteraceae bacterium]|jgi:hypothetical protein
MATEHITLGNALIAIHHPTFFEGYTSGYLRYARSDCQLPLTDSSIQPLFLPLQPFLNTLTFGKA